MKKISSSRSNIKDLINVTEEDVRRAERIENDPEKILRLVDLLFLFQEEDDKLPS